MIDRKQFFKQLFAGVSAGVLAANLPARTIEFLEQNETDFGALGDWEKLRKHFLHPTEYHYLNSGTLGLIPDLVVEAMEIQLRTRVAEGRYWLDPDAAPVVAKMIGAEADEIAITQNTTMGINIVAQGLPLKRKDEVILTTHEHVGNALPWLNRARRDGIRIKVFDPGMTAAENLERIKSLITKRTRVIAVPHVTCTTGTVMPLAAIAGLAKEKGLYFFVDGAHGPGMLPIDVKAIGCDFYSSCGHKWLCGPAGSGFLYIKKERLKEVDPIMVGAYSDKEWTLTKEKQEIGSFVESATLFEYGTRDPVKHGGLVAAINFMEGIGWTKIHNRQKELQRELRRRIQEMPEIKLLTPSEEGSYAAILGFRLPKGIAKEFEDILRERIIRVRKVKEVGLDSIRISMHIFNNNDDIDALIDCIKKTM